MASQEERGAWEFIRHLRHTAWAIARKVISKAVDGDLARRTELLYRARGGLFDETQELELDMINVIVIH